MGYDPAAYGETVAGLLALDGAGERLMPLVASGCPPGIASRLGPLRANDLFRGSARPAEAMAGLWLYFSGFEQAHGIVQDLSTPEACFWHAILHRQEPDAWNSGYWFRRVKDHPVFPALKLAAAQVAAEFPRAGVPNGARWDPLVFVEFCEQARSKPGSEAETAAKMVQRAEWQLLFDSCARVPR